MAKFDELSKLKVWNETVTKETRAWSDGLKANPPSKDFRVVQPHKMYFAEGKPAMARRAVDVQKERSISERAKSAEPSWEMTDEEMALFTDTVRESARTPNERHDRGTYKLHWRAGVEMRCNTPITSSHEIGWQTKPLVKPGPHSLRMRQRASRSTCPETRFADAYFATTRVPFTSKFAGTGR